MKTRLRCPLERTVVIGLRFWNGRVLSKAGPLGESGQKLVATGVGRLHAQGDLAVAELGELLAVAQLVDVDRREEVLDSLGLADAGHLPEVRHQVEFAEAREQGPPVAAE